MVATVVDLVFVILSLHTLQVSHHALPILLLILEFFATIVVQFGPRLFDKCLITETASATPAAQAAQKKASAMFW